MKKLRNYYLSALLITGLGFMSSCGGDEEDPAPVTPAVKEMSTYTAKILGNQNATPGSFFSSTDGTVYNSADAKTNSGKVDFLFYYSSPLSGDTAAANNAGTIASPKDTKAMEIYNNATTGIQTWTTSNATMFKRLGNTSTTYTNLANGDDVAKAYTNSTAPALTYVKRLRVNDIFGFVTAAGKQGVAKVESITEPTTANGNKSEINLNVKVVK